MLGDQNSATTAYIATAILLLGAAIATLGIAAQHADRSRAQARDQRRRHSEDVAELDNRVSGLERVTTGLDNRLETSVGDLTKTVNALGKAPRRSPAKKPAAKRQTKATS